MKLFKKMKDGGPKSNVDGYFLVEIKGLCSIALLKFNKGAREEFHTHAFNAFTWFIKGGLIELYPDKDKGKIYRRSIIPKFTPKGLCHKVLAVTDSWCLTVRGPWEKTWKEYVPEENITITFKSGRVITMVERGNKT